MNLKYQFSAAGLGDIIKARIYPLRPEVIREPGRGNPDSGYYEAGLPLVDARKWYGKYALCELMLVSEGMELVVPEAVVSVTRRKEIVTTRVVGGNGTVKEFIADDDVDISITIGIVATKNGDEKTLAWDEYPEDELRKMRKILDARKSIDVFSDFLDLFEISKIVVTDYNLVQSTHTNRQVVTINAVSDADYVIYSEEN
jgi:hypothetical protein